MAARKCFLSRPSDDLVTQKRRRCTNFTADERVILRRLVEPHEVVVTPDKIDKASVFERAVAWKEISRQYNKIIISDSPRTPVQLKQCYENIKRNIRRDVRTCEYKPVDESLVEVSLNPIKNERPRQAHSNCGSSVYPAQSSCSDQDSVDVKDPVRGASPVMRLEDGSRHTVFPEDSPRHTVLAEDSLPHTVPPENKRRRSVLADDVARQMLLADNVPWQALLVEDDPQQAVPGKLKRKIESVETLKTLLLRKHIESVNLDLEMHRKKYELELQVAQAKLDYYTKKRELLSVNSNSSDDA